MTIVCVRENSNHAPLAGLFLLFAFGFAVRVTLILARAVFDDVLILFPDVFVPAFFSPPVAVERHRHTVTPTPHGTTLQWCGEGGRQCSRRLLRGGFVRVGGSAGMCACNQQRVGNARAWTSATHDAGAQTQRSSITTNQAAKAPWSCTTSFFRGR